VQEVSVHYFFWVLLLYLVEEAASCWKDSDTDFNARRIGYVQVLCDEETGGGESSEVDKQKRKVFSCGSSAVSKDVYIFEGLFRVTVSFFGI